MSVEETMEKIKYKLIAMVEKRNFSHVSIHVWPRVILDMHEEEWAGADEEIKQFVKDNSIVVETWT